MNNELTGKWTPAVGRDGNAIGSALRRAAGNRDEPLPDELDFLLDLLEQPRRRAARS